MNKLILGCVILLLSVAEVFAADDANQSTTILDSVSQAVGKTANAMSAAESTTLDSGSVAASQPPQVATDASVSATSAKSYYHYPQARSSARSTKGFFSSLLELERKKNAWLKRTFLGM
jgi:hypothetical protein